MGLSTSQIERALEDALLLLLARYDRPIPTQLVYLILGQTLRIPVDWLRPVPTSSGYSKLKALGVDWRLLTQEELQSRVSTEYFFENEVRQAVRHLRDAELLHRRDGAERGAWLLTPSGRMRARSLAADIASGGAHAHLLERMVKLDGASHAADQEGAFEGPWNPERVLRSIVLRRGQPEFRDGLVLAYGGACALSECDAVEALEAAHIVPVAQGGVFKPQNGLLLRADLHTLYDLDLWAVDPGTKETRVAPALLSTVYGALDGAHLRSPSNPELAPSPTFLRARWERFERLAG